MSFAPPDPTDAPAVLLPPDSAADRVRHLRPGDLTGPWRVMLGLSWVGAFFAYAGIWQASVQVGIGTWWIGPRAQPTHVVIRLLPFVLALVMTLLVVYSVRHVMRWSAIGVLAAFLGAIPDFSRSVGLGIAEVVVAALVGVVTLGALSGRYRAADVSAAQTTAGHTTPG